MQSICLMVLLLFSPTATENVCDNGETRLVDGDREYEGRVELCYNGQWGTVCDRQINDNAAKVVCAQLSLQSDSEVTIIPHNDTMYILGPKTIIFIDPKVVLQFGDGKGPIHIYNVNCMGNEATLLECEHSKTEVKSHDQCVHLDDVGVSCDPPCSEGEVRLLKRRVQICHEQNWGYICGRDGWDRNATSVVCRELGFPSENALASSVYLYEQPTFQFFLQAPNCTGLEMNFTDCVVKYHTGGTVCSSGYAYHYAATAYCSGNEYCNETGEFRLREFRENTGRLEMCYDGYWGSVCANNKNRHIAAIACTELGFNDTIRVMTYPIGEFDVPLNVPDIPIVLDYVRCSGSETSLLDCSHNDFTRHRCVHYYDVVLECTVRCEEEDIRLVDGRTALEGRVEICWNGLWRSMCDDKWSYREAKVVCRELGYMGRSYALHEYGDVRPSDTFSCDGSETKLLNCLRVELGNINCVAGMPRASVMCTDTTCEEEAVRLVGGHSTKEGRVQVCHNAEWHSICSDEWTDSEAVADVICSTLGYSSQSVSVIASFGCDASPIFPKYILCDGSETTLRECEVTESKHLECGEVAGVICEAPCLSDDISVCDECSSHKNCRRVSDALCYCTSQCYSSGQCCPDIYHLSNCLSSDDDCVTGEVRLVGGVAHSSSGLLQVCIDRVWGTVCDYYNDWNHENAAVVCRQLNLPTSNVLILPFSVFGSATDHPVLLDNVHCTGTENHLLNCSHASIGNHFCSRHSQDILPIVALQCKTDCGEGEVRLEDGTDRSNGRVEICQYGIWGSVCSTEWDINDTIVVCRQLGFESEDVEVRNGFGSGGSVLMSNVQCNGSEGGLYLCPSARIGNHTCQKGSSSSAGVICSRHFGNDGLTSRLVGGIIAAVAIVGTSVIAVIVVNYYLRRRNRQKRVGRLQSDILASYCHEVESDMPACARMEVTNQYIQDRLSVIVTERETRGRLNSYHLRELVRGKLIIKSEQLSKLENIGQGEFGIVYKARLGPRGTFNREVAVKTLKGTFDQHDIDGFVEESIKMSRFKHPHVMGLIGVCLDSGSAPYIVMPYMANGSLLEYLKRERDSLVFPEGTDDDEVQDVKKRLMVMCSEITSGMEYLAAQKYIHRDLAARNCMIDAHFVIKISDFGLSEDVFLGNYYREGVDGEVAKLPFKWMAPESLSDGHFSEKSDVWSYGVTMWEIFSGGKSPYPGTNPINLIQMLEAGERMPKPYNAVCSKDIYMVMTQCWEAKPENRPAFKELYGMTSAYIEGIAGYLEMSYNPFSGPESTDADKNKGGMEGLEATVQ